VSPVIDFATDPGLDFWAQFPHNNAMLGKSTICPEKLRSLAWAVGFKDMELLETVCQDLTIGADIGCKGPARLPTVSGNAPSASEFGQHVTDAIADWL
jgi:hypothetical protein